MLSFPDYCGTWLITLCIAGWGVRRLVKDSAPFLLYVVKYDAVAVANPTRECPICLTSDRSTVMVKLPCKHDFHHKCVEEYVMKDKSTHRCLKCPLCRTETVVSAELSMPRILRATIERFIQNNLFWLGSFVWLVVSILRGVPAGCLVLATAPLFTTAWIYAREVGRFIVLRELINQRE